MCLLHFLPRRTFSSSLLSISVFPVLTLYSITFATVGMVEERDEFEFKFSLDFIQKIVKKWKSKAKLYKESETWRFEIVEIQFT